MTFRDVNNRTDREYIEMLYSLALEQGNISKLQHGTIINTLAGVQKDMLAVQNNLGILVSGLSERHEQRFQQEIEEKEADIENLKERIRIMELQVEEKKQAAREATTKTSQDIERIALNTYQEAQTQQLAERQKTSQANWLKWRDLAIGSVLTYIVVKLIPEIFQMLAK